MVYCEKMADSIEMLFGVVGHVGPRNHVGSRSYPRKEHIFFLGGGTGWRNATYRENVISAMQKRLN